MRGYRSNWSVTALTANETGLDRNRAVLECSIVCALKESLNGIVDVGRGCSLGRDRATCGPGKSTSCGKPVKDLICIPQLVPGPELQKKRVRVEDLK